MQIVLTEEEYRKLKATHVPTDEYDKWIEKVRQASSKAIRDIIHIIGPSVHSTLLHSTEKETIRSDLKAAFKSLDNELENHPNSKTKEI